MIHLVTLGFAAADADHRVREVGGNNFGPRIKQYLDSLDPPIAQGAPWCAAFVQYCSDRAAKVIGKPNPLDAVKLEALVQSYYDQFEQFVVKDGTKPGFYPEAGQLALFKFPVNGKPADRWNHIGIVAQYPVEGGSIFWCVEGNTGDVSQRDGDGVHLKPRDMTKQPTCFIRWGA